MAYLTIRGVEHYYEWMTAKYPQGGESATPTGKPVLVFLHGWAGSTRYWRTTAQALTPEFDCLLYDLRGFGRSRLPRPLPEAVTALGYDLEGYADELVELLDRFNLGQVVLNAHSTGASIAALFLQRYGDRVKQAILTCSGIFDYNPVTFSVFHWVGGYVVKFRPRWFLRIPSLDRMFMVRFLRQSIPSSESRAFLEDFIDADPEAALGTIYTAVSEKAAREMPQVFSSLTVPTLLISGQYDQIIPVRLGAKAAALNPNIQHVVIPETGHFPMLEDADTYIQTVRTFLNLNSVPV